MLDHQFATLLSFLATITASVLLFVFIPKGFFPQQDTGFIRGSAVAGQDSSSEVMRERILEVAEIVQRDPDVAAFGVNMNGGSFNSGTFFPGPEAQGSGTQTHRGSG